MDNIIKRGFLKINPAWRRLGPVSAVEVNIHTFFSLALGGREWSASLSCLSILRKESLVLAGDPRAGMNMLANSLES